MTISKPGDFEIDNDTGANVRTDLNNVFGALRSNNGEYSGAPTTLYPYMWYADIGTGKMSFYLATPGNGKIDFISLTDGSFFGPNGSASNPSYTFTNSASTGFYRSASNQIGVSNNSVNTALFKTTGTEIKGKLEVAPASGDADFDIKTSGNSNDSAINLIADTTHTTGGLTITRKQSANGNSEILHKGTGDFILDNDGKAEIRFKTDSTERWHISGNDSDSSVSPAIDTRGSLISHNITASQFLTTRGAVFWSKNDVFEGLSLVKSGTTWGTVLHINRLAAAGLPDTGGNGRLIEFNYDSSGVGTISTNGSATAYNVGSDYRLKDNIVDLTDGITRLKTLKTYRFCYKNNSSLTVDGFLAHEVTAVPEAITGVKDEVDSEGKPVYQQIDQSKLVPLLTAALQEAIVKIETLETKVAALEGA
tara:strand:- start:946 stop:2211 length:1266 start_codon:yes stop_codon:yes gene_type:complete